MAEEDDDKFIKENPIIFKKYRIKKKLGEGAFGDVYLGQTIENNSYVAIKVEQRKIIKPILESEAFLLYSIAGLGIPEVKSFGKVKNYNILVEPLLGKSLFDIFTENHKKMNPEDVCLIGKQVIDRIQWIHSKYIVHRDIKPDNFLIGRKDPNVIYLIDFGLSKKYRSSTTNKHIRFGFTGKLTGTVRFASANALRGGEQSRRDDIESIGYMLIYFLKQRLPWQGITGNKKMERYLKIYKMKKNTTPEELCSGFPEMIDYIAYAKKLEFEQEPDYNYLRRLFITMLKRIHNTNDQLVFSWIKLADLPNLKNPVNPAIRKDSPQSRIYKKIKSNLEKERNLSSNSDSKNDSYQQIQSQRTLPSTNLKAIDKNNNNNYNTENEIEPNADKKENKKSLKMKEGLNTTIANLDVTVDENIVDFENERLKKESKDTRESFYFKNNNDKNASYNQNISNKNIHLSDKKNNNNYCIKNSMTNINSENQININLKSELNDIMKNNKENDILKNIQNNNLENNISENKEKNNIDNKPNDNLDNINNIDNKWNDKKEEYNLDNINNNKPNNKKEELNLEINSNKKMFPEDHYSLFPDDIENISPNNNLENNNLNIKKSHEINNNIYNNLNNEDNNKLENNINQNNIINQNINNNNNIKEKNKNINNNSNKRYLNNCKNIKKALNYRNKSTKNNRPAMNINSSINNTPNNNSSNNKTNSSKTTKNNRNVDIKHIQHFTYNEQVDNDNQYNFNNPINYNKKEKNKIDGNKNNDIYALITSNNNIINTSKSVGKKQNKNNINLESINNFDDISEYLRLNTQNNNNKLNTNTKYISNQNRNNINNYPTHYNINTENPNNNIGNANIKRKIIIKRIKKCHTNKNSLNPNININENNNNNYLNNENNLKKYKSNKLYKSANNNINENNNNKSYKGKSHEINNNPDIYKQINKDIGGITFPNDNDLDNNLVSNRITIGNKIIRKISPKKGNSTKKLGHSKMIVKTVLDSNDFFNEYNNDLFDYNKSEINNNNNNEDFSNTMNGKIKNNALYYSMNNEKINNNINKSYKGSVSNFCKNLKNNSNYGYLNQNNIYYSLCGNNKSKNNLNKNLNNKNNIEKENSNNNNIDLLKEGKYTFQSIDILKERNNNNLQNNPITNVNIKEQELNQYVNNINAKKINKQNIGEISPIKLNNKNNYMYIIGRNDNYSNNQINQNNLKNKKNANINNNINLNSNNQRINNLQSRKSPGNQQKNNIKGFKGGITKIKKLPNNEYKQKMIDNNINSTNNMDNLNQINNKINNINNISNSNNLNQINNNINNNLNINLINNNINNRQQIYYQIPGYINNNILNQYNIQYLNNITNFQPSDRIVNSNIPSQNYILFNPTNIQRETNQGIKQGVQIQFPNNNPNHYNPYGKV